MVRTLKPSRWGDLNGDGKLDLLTGGQDINFSSDPTAPKSVGVLLGNGNGTFAAASTFSNGKLMVYEGRAAEVTYNTNGLRG